MLQLIIIQAYLLVIHLCLIAGISRVTWTSVTATVSPSTQLICMIRRKNPSPAAPAMVRSYIIQHGYQPYHTTRSRNHVLSKNSPMTSLVMTSPLFHANHEHCMSMTLAILSTVQVWTSFCISKGISTLREFSKVGVYGWTCMSSVLNRSQKRTVSQYPPASKHTWDSDRYTWQTVNTSH